MFEEERYGARKIRRGLHECLSDLQKTSHRITKAAVASSFVAIALAAVVSSAPASHGILALQEIWQTNAKLLRDASENPTADQRHEYEEEKLSGVSSCVVKQFSEEMLELMHFIGLATLNDCLGCPTHEVALHSHHAVVSCSMS